uniref:Uncharacterized protein n=1 Tax=Lutzomyia longipalpis TaxID=7200 RepID=A0A7G3B5R3_LUTLO
MSPSEPSLAFVTLASGHFSGSCCWSRSRTNFSYLWTFLLINPFCYLVFICPFCWKACSMVFLLGNALVLEH